MSDDLSRRYFTPPDLEIRGDGRTVYGIAVPFDTEAHVRDARGPAYREVFRQGAFAKTITESGGRVKLLINHDRERLPIGKALELKEDRAGLIAQFRVSNTREGDEALELVRDGVLDAFSVGFIPVKHRGSELVERLEVKLREVSVVAFPAYDSALIGGVRIDPGTPESEAAAGTPGIEAADTEPEPAEATRRLDPLLVAQAAYDLRRILKEIKK